MVTHDLETLRTVCDRVAALAEAWGSRFVNVGNVGHLNPAAGFGHWQQAEALIQELDR